MTCVAHPPGGSALPTNAPLVAVVIDVILVGIARMALNEHYPTDLLGGLFGAVAALSMYTWFTRVGGWAGPPSSTSVAADA